MIPSHWRRHPSFPILNASLQEAASPCAHCSRKGFTLILSAGTSWSLRQSASPWEGARAACGSSQLCSNRAVVAVNINGKSPPSVPSCSHVGFSPHSHCLKSPNGHAIYSEESLAEQDILGNSERKGHSQDLQSCAANLETGITIHFPPFFAHPA